MHRSEWSYYSDSNSRKVAKLSKRVTEPSPKVYLTMEIPANNTRLRWHGAVDSDGKDRRWYLFAVRCAGDRAACASYRQQLFANLPSKPACWQATRTESQPFFLLCCCSSASCPLMLCTLPESAIGTYPNSEERVRSSTFQQEKSARGQDASVRARYNFVICSINCASGRVLACPRCLMGFSHWKLCTMCVIWYFRTAHIRCATRRGYLWDTTSPPVAVSRKGDGEWSGISSTIAVMAKVRCVDMDKNT